ncbi:MAG: hypothetical protein PHX43_09530 [Alphaproteobacteria bacterium]|nr:hypothetical protein [Alphaproteobacteria bacterium]
MKSDLQEDLHFRLCVMLAFQSMITDGSKTEDAAERIIELAKTINEFCDLHIPKAFPLATAHFVNDVGASKIDNAILQHIEKLRTKGTTQLPEDRETLIQFYDRLQQRKSRRLQWQFYATAKEEKLADLVLHLLDEEIEDMNAEGIQ